MDMQQLQDIFATTIGNTHALEFEFNHSKHEIVQPCSESNARFNSVMLTNVTESYFSDTHERRYCVVSKLKTI